MVTDPTLQDLRAKRAFICDMDGVVYHGRTLLPGVVEFVSWLKAEKKRFLFLTNSSGQTPRELSRKLERMGIDVAEQHFYTSALATAMFLSSQTPTAAPTSSATRGWSTPSTSRASRWTT